MINYLYNGAYFFKTKKPLNILNNSQIFKLYMYTFFSKIVIRKLDMSFTLLTQLYNTILLTIVTCCPADCCYLFYLLELYTHGLATLNFSLFPSPGNDHPTLGFCEFGYFRYLIYVESCNTCPSITDLFHLV